MLGAAGHTRDAGEEAAIEIVAVGRHHSVAVGDDPRLATAVVGGGSDGEGRAVLDRIGPKGLRHGYLQAALSVAKMVRVP